MRGRDSLQPFQSWILNVKGKERWNRGLEPVSEIGERLPGGSAPDAPGRDQKSSSLQFLPKGRFDPEAFIGPEVYGLHSAPRPPLHSLSLIHI